MNPASQADAEAKPQVFSGVPRDTETQGFGY